MNTNKIDIVFITLILCQIILLLILILSDPVNTGLVFFVSFLLVLLLSFWVIIDFKSYVNSFDKISRLSLNELTEIVNHLNNNRKAENKENIETLRLLNMISISLENINHNIQSFSTEDPLTKNPPELQIKSLPSQPHEFDSKSSMQEVQRPIISTTNSSDHHTNPREAGRQSKSDGSTFTPDLGKDKSSKEFYQSKYSLSDQTLPNQQTPLYSSQYIKTVYAQSNGREEFLTNVLTDGDYYTLISQSDPPTLIQNAKGSYWVMNVEDKGINMWTALYVIRKKSNTDPDTLVIHQFFKVFSFTGNVPNESKWQFSLNTLCFLKKIDGEILKFEVEDKGHIEFRPS